MAAPIGSIYVSLTADVQPFARGMSRAEAVTASAAQNIRRSAGLAESAVVRFQSAANRNFKPHGLIATGSAFQLVTDRASVLRSTLQQMTGIVGGFAAALSTNQILRTADSFTKLTNQIRAVSDDSADTAARFDAVREAAASSRSSLEATAVLYSRIQKATPATTADQVLRYVTTIQKALALGGATAAEAAGAAIQFSQAIASNRLSGDEIRAVLETPLGLELAKGLGVTIGKLREMGTAGQLTADVVLGGLRNIETEIDQKFAKSVGTLDQAMVNLDNQFISFIGKANQSLGVTQLLGRGIDSLANNLDAVVPTLGAVAAGVLAVLAARNKGLIGAAGVGGLGALLGGTLGGTSGAILGGLAGGVLGRGLPEMLSGIKTSGAAAAQSLEQTTSRVLDLRKELSRAVTDQERLERRIRLDTNSVVRPRVRNDLTQAARVVDPDPSVGNITALNKARVAYFLDLKKKQDDAGASVAKLSAALEIQEGRLAAAGRAATLAGQAKAFLGRQVSSLVGLFGGPWGIAITGAITVLGLLGARAQQEAQKVAEARALIDEVLDREAEKGSGAAAKTVLDRRIDKYNEQIKILRGLVDDASAAVKSGVIQLGSVNNLAPANQIIDLINALADGRITLDQFQAGLVAVGQNGSSGLRYLAEQADAAGRDILGAGQAARSLLKDVQDLERQASSGDIRFQVAFDSSSDRSNKTFSDTADAKRDLYADIAVSKLRAQGLKAEADALQIVNAAKSQGKEVSYDAILSLVKEKDALDAQASSLKKSAAAAETLTQRLSRLKAESTGAFLSDLDRDVVRQARELKVAAKDIEAYVKAAQSGDFSKAPKLLNDLRDQNQFEERQNPRAA